MQTKYVNPQLHPLLIYPKSVSPHAQKKQIIPVTVSRYRIPPSTPLLLTPIEIVTKWCACGVYHRTAACASNCDRQEDLISRPLAGWAVGKKKAGERGFKLLIGVRERLAFRAKNRNIDESERYRAYRETLLVRLYADE